jgi:hypothetical protein
MESIKLKFNLNNMHKIKPGVSPLFISDGYHGIPTERQSVQSSIHSDNVSSI